jgi:hypothetical protein
VSEATSPAGPWASRIGAAAASARRSFQRMRIVGIVLLLCIPVGAALIVVLFQTHDGNPSVASVAVVAVIGVLAGVIGFAMLSVALDSRGKAIDSAVAFLRHSYADVTPFEVQELLRSPSAFDAGLTGRVAAPATETAAPANMTWTPDLVRPILPGVPESALVVIHRRIGAVGVIGVVILALLAVVHRVPSLRIWYSGWAVVGAILVVSFAFWLAAIARGRQEFREGYTTSPTGTQLVGRGQLRPVDAHTSLDFVDGKTGYLLRHANAVLLTPDRYAGRLQQIRAAHPGASPQRIEPTPG